MVRVSHPFILLVFCLTFAFPCFAATAPFYSITITAGFGGKITPASAAVSSGGNKAFTLDHILEMNST
jgi:type 1 fimbria pilin